MTAPAREVRREDLISRRAAAQQLGIHANTLDREARRRNFKPYRLLGDNRLFYLREDIATIRIVGEA